MVDCHCSNRASVIKEMLTGFHPHLIISMNKIKIIQQSMRGLLSSVFFLRQFSYHWRLFLPHIEHFPVLRTLVQGWKETISPEVVQFTSYGRVCVLDCSKIV